MGRVRLFYEKRGGACFVPHLALATVFTRAAGRAGIKLRLTQGFSPHARMSFGPELPAGIVALCEPVDIWLEEEGENGISPFLWNGQMPEGFRVVACRALAEDAPSLGKDCRAAHCLIWPNGRVAGKTSHVGGLLSHLRAHYGEDVLSASLEESDGDAGAKISLVLANPAGNGLGGWVRALVASKIVAGWQDLCIVRMGLGRWNGIQMEPLALGGMGRPDCQGFSSEEGIACLQGEKFQGEKIQTEKFQREEFRTEK
ncbi:MAG: TIGR03936 family radical SAM-associated protein [Synergistaceae bacterium]|jgi:hypothetical protein|nr:TIGR03936 family radical SAM-associated protein [Synergistaceae bacterium]